MEVRRPRTMARLREHSDCEWYIRVGHVSQGAHVTVQRSTPQPGQNLYEKNNANADRK